MFQIGALVSSCLTLTATYDATRFVGISQASRGASMRFKRKSAVAVAGLILSLLGVTSPSLATIVLDQANDQGFGNLRYNGGSPNLTWQQGITAGQSGKLNSVDLYFWGAGNIELQLSSGAPWNQSPQYSRQISVSAGWNTVDVSQASLNLSVGQQFSLGLHGLGLASDFDPAFSGTVLTDSYLGGSLYLNGSQFVPQDRYDMGFRTYVETASGPPSLPPVTPPPTGITIDGLATFDPSKPTVVITHGWQPTPFGDPRTWVDQMASALDQAAAGGAGSVNILRVFWDDAKTLSLSEATAEVGNVGQQLANALKGVLGNATAGLQFIGHSLGTHVNAHASNALTHAGYTVNQFTILDRPFASFGPFREDIDQAIFRNLLEKDRVTWVDNYFGNSIILPPSTGETFQGTALAFDHLYAGANHTDVHQQYANTIVAGAACGGEGGFGCSIISGNFASRPAASFWDPLLSNATQSSNLININSATWSVINCNIGGSGFASCQEGSPAYLWSDSFNIASNDKFLSFDFEWFDKGDGDWLTLHFDDILLYSFSGQSFPGSGKINSGLIPISHLSGRTGQMLFTLNSVGLPNADLSIGNIKTYGSLTSSVPEPETYALMILGFGFLGSIMRRRSSRLTPHISWA